MPFTEANSSINNKPILSEGSTVLTVGPFSCPEPTNGHGGNGMNPPSPESTRHYPEALEKWWKERVEESHVHTLENLHRNASVLSDHFTVKRNKGFPDYFKKPGHLLAYGIYFHPQSWVRTRFPLLEVIEHRGWMPDENEDIHILDIGSGPGSACLSVLQLLHARFPERKVRVTAIDQSPHALDTLRHCHADLNHLWPKSSVRIQSKNLRHRSTLFYGGRDRFDLVVLSFSLNEFTTSSTPEEVVGLIQASCRKLLKKHGLLLIIEPALKETSENLRSLADSLVADGALHNWGPYLHAGPCPLQQTNKFWSHEVRSWHPPESMQYLNRRMQRRIHELKFSYVAMSPTSGPSAPKNAEHFRLVSPMSRMKGHFLMSGVAGDGLAHTYELMFRNLDSEQKRTLRKIERGDILQVKNLEQFGDRLRIPSFGDIVQHYHVS